MKASVHYYGVFGSNKVGFILLTSSQRSIEGCFPSAHINDLSFHGSYSDLNSNFSFTQSGSIKFEGFLAYVIPFVSAYR